jgi:hypothetical protein
MNFRRCRETVNPEDGVRGSPRSSATAREELPLGVGRRHGGRTLVGGRGFAVPVQPTKQIGSRGVERTVFCVIGTHAPQSVLGPLTEGVTLNVPGIQNFNHSNGGDNDYVQIS